MPHHTITHASKVGFHNTPFTQSRRVSYGGYPTELPHHCAQQMTNATVSTAYGESTVKLGRRGTHQKGFCSSCFFERRFFPSRTLTSARLAAGGGISLYRTPCGPHTRMSQQITRRAPLRDQHDAAVCGSKVSDRATVGASPTRGSYCPL